MMELLLKQYFNELEQDLNLDLFFAKEKLKNKARRRVGR